MAAPRLRRFWYDPKGNRSGLERHEPLSGFYAGAADECRDAPRAKWKTARDGASENR